MAEPQWTFNDNTLKVLSAMDDSVMVVLEECAAEIETQTKQNSRVKTTKTKNSFKHKVAKDGYVYIANIGSDEKNAIWEEFGTGEHALMGNGRKGGWHYKDEKGNWHFTRGKRPSRAFWNAYISLKDAIINRIKAALKGL